MMGKLYKIYEKHLHKIIARTAHETEIVSNYNAQG
jgi:hypothetical protein